MKKVLILLVIVFSCREEAEIENDRISKTDYKTFGVVNVNYRGQVLTAWKDENGDYIINEDMILHKKEVTELKNYSNKVIADWDKLEVYHVDPWPRAEIDYRIDAGFDAAKIALIKQAILHWTDKTDISFTEVASGETVLFKPVSSGCSSPVGYPGLNGKNTINISSSCDLRSITHEIGHTVGLIHEHQKVDRDSYLTLQPGTFNYIKTNYNIDLYNRVVQNLLKEDNNLGDPFPFDMGSLMIYGSYPQNAIALRNDLISHNLPLYTKKDGSLVDRPATHELSNKDIQLVNYYYSKKIILKNVDYSTIQLKIRLQNLTDPATLHLNPGNQIVLYYDKNKQKYTYSGYVVQQLDLNDGSSSDDINFSWSGNNNITYSSNDGNTRILIHDYVNSAGTKFYQFTDRDGINGGTGNAIIESLQENYFNTLINLKAWGSTTTNTNAKEHHFTSGSINQLILKNSNYDTLNNVKIRLEGTSDPTLTLAPGDSVSFTYDGTDFKYQGYKVQQIDFNNGGSSDDLSFSWSPEPGKIVTNWYGINSKYHTIFIPNLMDWESSINFGLLFFYKINYSLLMYKDSLSKQKSLTSTKLTYI